MAVRPEAIDTIAIDSATGRSRQELRARFVVELQRGYDERGAPHVGLTIAVINPTFGGWLVDEDDRRAVD